MPAWSRLAGSMLAASEGTASDSRNDRSCLAGFGAGLDRQAHSPMVGADGPGRGRASVKISRRGASSSGGIAPTRASTTVVPSS